MIKRLAIVEFEKFPLYNIVHGGTGTGKTYFVRQYLKLYINDNSSVKPDQDQEQERDQRSMAEHQGTCFADGQRPIIIACKSEKDWINPATGFPYVGFEMGDMNMITIKSIDKFQNNIIVLDDMGSEFSHNMIWVVSLVTI